MPNLTKLHCQLVTCWLIVFFQSHSRQWTQPQEIPSLGPTVNLRPICFGDLRGTPLSVFVCCKRQQVLGLAIIPSKYAKRRNLQPMISMCETCKTTTTTTTKNQPPTPSYQQQATSKQQQTSNNQQPTANNEQQKQQCQFQAMSMLKLQTNVHWKWEIARALYADVCSCVCVSGMSVCFSVCFAGWPRGCLFRLY